MTTDELVREVLNYAKIGESATWDHKHVRETLTHGFRWMAAEIPELDRGARVEERERILEAIMRLDVIDGESLPELCQRIVAAVKGDDDE